MEKGSSILVFSGPIHNNNWFILFVITLPIVALFIWLLENFSKTEGLKVKIKGTSLLRAKWMYVCVFFVCIHCLPVFFSFYSNLTILLRIFAHIAVLHRNAFFAFLQSLNKQNTSAFHHFIDFDVR